MAKFEGYERREAKILACLKEYGISSIDECKEICDAKGIDPYKIVEETQPIAFENAVWAYTLGAAIAFKTGAKDAAEAAYAYYGNRGNHHKHPPVLTEHTKGGAPIFHIG